MRLLETQACFAGSMSTAAAILAVAIMQPLAILIEENAQSSSREYTKFFIRWLYYPLLYLKD